MTEKRPKPKSKSDIPPIKLHKASGQAYCRIGGRLMYLGKYGSPECEEKHRRIVAEWKANRTLPQTKASLTVMELIIAYLKHAKAYYRDGTEYQSIYCALGPVKELYGTLEASRFSPTCLRAVRERMIERGWVRASINRAVGRVRSMLKWAASHEMLPVSIWQTLQTVEPLKAGRSDAKESTPVEPVAEADIEAVRPHVSRQVWALIQLQLATGARAGELVGLRPMDLDMSSDVWRIGLAKHKTSHHGHKRCILVGPRGQDVIRPFLIGRATDKPLFSPADAEAERRASMHAERKTPPHHGNAPGTNRNLCPDWTPGEAYTVASYRRCIQRACDAAGIKRWSPHALRHNAATVLRAEFGIDVAATVLGHKIASRVTELYAAPNVAKALEAVRRIG